ncbi:MAG TPA: hypothetical protein VF303_03420 [Candidatus Nanoarchaeia archaeon]
MIKTLLKRKKITDFIKEKTGLALIQAIILITIIASLLLVIVSLTLLGLNVAKQGVRQTSALDVAEAGVNYYLWHLVHAPEDHKDGNDFPADPPFGPYTHDVTDNTGKKIGTYTLWVTPPEAGGDLVTVESKGTIEDGNENRTIVAKLGIPTFAQYAVVTNDTVNHIRFGLGTEVFGPIHNNGGVRFDGVAHDLVSSSLATYNDPDHPGGVEPGVHTHQPDPDEVFLGGTAFPVPPVDFGQISSELDDLKTRAQDNGINYEPSGASGYHIVLKTNDTFDIYRVNSTTASCRNPGNDWQATDGITNQTLISGSVPFPNNGVIFVEDKLWIDGKINGANLTIAAATLPDNPATYKSIIINNDLEYTNYDGTDKVGLVAQGNVSAGLFSEGAFTGTDDEKELRVNAALIAQNGRVGRNYFHKNCSSTYYQRNIITVYGAIATNQRYGFTWICGNAWTENDSCDSGYKDRNVTYDQYLSANPPPYFPRVGNYAILDWRER